MLTSVIVAYKVLYFLLTGISIRTIMSRLSSSIFVSYSDIRITRCFPLATSRNYVIVSQFFFKHIVRIESPVFSNYHFSRNVKKLANNPFEASEEASCDRNFSELSRHSSELRTTFNK